MELRTARAEVLLRRGEVEAALQPAREAVEFADGTDVLNSRGNAREASHELSVERGEPTEAVEQAELARAEYERKGNVVSVRAIRGFLDELAGA